MSNQVNGLGGRLPLLEPKALQTDQKELYDEIDSKLMSWARESGFVGKTDDGHFIGPFNPFLYSPNVSQGFLKLQEAESKFTSLDKRVREVVILSLGAVWESKYELYAHSAVARKAGLSEQVIQALASGKSSEELTTDEMIAHRFARQLTTEHQVDADLYQEAEQAFGPTGLMDMMYLIGIYLFTCALLNGFKIPVPEGNPSG